MDITDKIMLLCIVVFYIGVFIWYLWEVWKFTSLVSDIVIKYYVRKGLIKGVLPYLIHQVIVTLVWATLVLVPFVISYLILNYLVGGY
ncbi:hypothetical protein VL10_ORF176 [Staphylococcus phage vB_SauM_VL10]|nr:hypothetical protein VL10_ORF176 [Staphylococcus phage vB_SauM_VL10]